MIDNDTIQQIKILWDYMKLNQEVTPCDIMIGCGCASLSVARRCSNLLKNGYAPKVIFSGGLGKCTKGIFSKTEAEIYREVALQEGVLDEMIWLEKKSTNTGDNFKFSKQLLQEKQILYNSILVVCNGLSERRNLAAAKAVFPEKDIIITSPQISFSEFISNLQNEKNLTLSSKEIISVLVGDIQRLMIFPQFGWQIEEKVPSNVLQVYQQLKQKGYTTYIYSKSEIQKLIDVNGLIQGKDANFFN